MEFSNIAPFIGIFFFIAFIIYIVLLTFGLLSCFEFIDYVVWIIICLDIIRYYYILLYRNNYNYI